MDEKPSVDQSLNNNANLNYHLDCAAALRALNDTMSREFYYLREEIKRPKRRFLIFISIGLFIYAAMFLIVSIIMSFVDFAHTEYTKDNTTELTVTISKIQPIPYCLQFSQYNAVFSIYSEQIVVDMDQLSMLTVGQEVTIRISEADYNNLSRLSSSIDLVSLKGSSDIITLESYNDYFRSTGQPPTVAFFVLTFLFAGGAVLCLFLYRRKNPKKKPSMW